jgi:hypothetical protein
MSSQLLEDRFFSFLCELAIDIYFHLQSEGECTMAQAESRIVCQAGPPLETVCFSSEHLLTHKYQTIAIRQLGMYSRTFHNVSEKAI